VTVLLLDVFTLVRGASANVLGAIQLQMFSGRGFSSRRSDMATYFTPALDGGCCGWPADRHAKSPVMM
jgi:hypothetical protein